MENTFAKMPSSDIDKGNRATVSLNQFLMRHTMVSIKQQLPMISISTVKLAAGETITDYIYGHVEAVWL